MKTNVCSSIELASFDATTLTNAYQVVNLGGFEHPCGIVHIINTSGVSIMFSYDGVNDHDVIGAHKSSRYDIQLNAFYKALQKKGTQIYVKYILGAGKGGNIYITGYTTER